MQTDIAEMMGCAEYAALPEVQRGRCRRGLNCLEALPEGLSPTAPGGIGARLAAALGVSEKSALRLYYAYREQRRWQVFIDRRTTPQVQMARGGANCARFKAWVQQIVEANQRSTAAAITEIHRAFYAKRGAVLIPGFEEHEGGFVPSGCSVSSLRAKIQRWCLKNVRQGLKSNAEHQLSTLTTREGLKPGQVYMFDDVWHDNLVQVGPQAVRVLEFGALDVASACRVHWGHIPALLRATETKVKRDGLTQAHFVLFLAHLLYHIGYHKDGVTLIMEHGTATLPKGAAELLCACVPGLSIRMGGITGIAQKLLGGYTGQVGGNPRTKAHLESSHNGIHNFLAWLPGQVGKNRQSIQEATYGRQKEAHLLAQWREDLCERGREDLAAALVSPFLTYAQFNELVLLAYMNWNSRREHRLEGWSRNTVLEYMTAPNQWLPADRLQMTPLMAEMVRANPSLCREVKLSPAEVWERGKGELVRIPQSVYVDLLRTCKGLTREARVYGGMFKVQDKLLAPQPMVYLGEVITPDGQRRLLGEDTRWQVLLNPYSEEGIMVLDERGCVVGEAPLYKRVPLADEAALHEQIGRVASVNARRLAAQRANWQGETERVAAQRAANRAIATEGGLLERRAPAAAALPLRRGKPKGSVDAFEGLGRPDALPVDEVERPSTPVIDFSDLL